MERVFNVIFRPEPEGGFTAIVPSLPGCVTYGKTLALARRMAQEATDLYIESLKKHREPIPDDDFVYVTSIRVPVRKAKKRKVYA